MVNNINYKCNSLDVITMILLLIGSILSFVTGVDAGYSNGKYNVITYAVIVLICIIIISIMIYKISIESRSIVLEEEKLVYVNTRTDKTITIEKQDIIIAEATTTQYLIKTQQNNYKINRKYISTEDKNKLDTYLGIIKQVTV